MGARPRIQPRSPHAEAPSTTTRPGGNPEIRSNRHPSRRSGGGCPNGRHQSSSETTSTAAMFHWSVVGAVSLIVTDSPAGPVTLPVYWDQ